jgi:hypothetical protein
MPTGAHERRAAKMVQPHSDDDPYAMLVLAIVRRAVDDAQGCVVHPGTRSPAQIEVEARAWLAEEHELVALLELAGCDAAPVVQRVRQMLTNERERR